MASLQVTAVFPSISPTNAAEFKQLAADALAAATAEPGTLQYDWFFSPDGTRCVVRETYADSAAALEHLTHVGPMVGRLADLGGGIELDVFGAPSSELSAAVAFLNPTVYHFAQGK